MNEYTVSTDQSRLDLPMIHAFLSQRSYWAKGRSLATVKRSVSNSLCFGLYNAAGRQIGFARVVTDGAVFAYILDVFILEGFRGRGLGQHLMAQVMAHPDLQGLQRIMLATQDAHGLYAKYGFRPTVIGDKLMEIVQPPR